MLLACLSAATMDALVCASACGTVLAGVNGHAITDGDLMQRIELIHTYKSSRRPEAIEKKVDVLSLLEQLIDERLVIEEAYRLKLDGEPGLEEALRQYTAAQSVIRLRKEEVADKAVVVEQEVLDYFKKHHGASDNYSEEQVRLAEGKIKTLLARQKEKELSDEYIAALRKRSDIRIDEKLLDRLDPESDYADKQSVVARANGEPITAGDLLLDLKRAYEQSVQQHDVLSDRERARERNRLKQETLHALVTYKLIEQEALRRNYMQDEGFAWVVRARKELLLIGQFKEKIIYPLAIPSEKELTKYYEEHINEFMTDYDVWFGEMIFQRREEADEALGELAEGANFEYLGPRVSSRWSPKSVRVWVGLDSLSDAVRNELSALEIGETSGVFEDSGNYKIVKLKGRKGGRPEEFSRVTARLEKISLGRNFDIILEDYLERLRRKADIKIDRSAVKGLEDNYWGGPGQSETSY